MQSGVFSVLSLVAIGQAETCGHGEIHLVGGDGEFAADGAPDLHVDLRAVERRFVRHFDVVDAGLVENVAHHVFGFLPQLRFVDEFLAPSLRADRAC